MNYWNKIPLFRILLAFLIGIIPALSFQFSITYLYIITAFLSVGILLITRINLENIVCKQIIIDSSVPKYKWEQIKKECRKLDIPFYNVNTQGAYLFNITS